LKVSVIRNEGDGRKISKEVKKGVYAGRKKGIFKAKPKRTKELKAQGLTEQRDNEKSWDWKEQSMTLLGHKIRLELIVQFSFSRD
jgi:hypothetical protein